MLLKKLKKIKFRQTLNLLNFFILIILFNSCSFDKKTGIWENKPEIRKEYIVKKEILIAKNKFIKEINPNLNLNFKSNTIANLEWPMSGYNNSNLLPHFKFSPSKFKLFKYKLKKIKDIQIKENPMIIGNNYFITHDSEGSIIKFSNNKKKTQWSLNIYDKKEKKKISKINFLISEKVVYVSDNLGKYYAINLNTGEILWSYLNDSPFISQIKSINNFLIMIDSNNVVNCYFKKNGKLVWNYKTKDSFIKSLKNISFIVTKKYLIFSNTSGDIIKLNINNGRKIWSIPTQNILTLHSANFYKISDLVKYENSIYFSNNLNQFFSLDIETGIINWLQNINSTIRPIIIDKYLFTISSNGYLILINKEEGNILRSNNLFINFRTKKEIFAQGFLVASNKIYITTNIGVLLICSISSGKLEKILKINNSMLSEPLLVNNNLYIRLNDSLAILQ